MTMDPVRVTPISDVKNSAPALISSLFLIDRSENRISKLHTLARYNGLWGIVGVVLPTT